MHYHRFPVQQVTNSHASKRFLLEGRLHRHIQRGRCRSPSPPTIRSHTASQCERSLTRSGNRPYVPYVQVVAAHARSLAADMPKSRCPPATHSEYSWPTPIRCWRSLGPPSRALGVRLNSSSKNSNHGNEPSGAYEV